MVDFFLFFSLEISPLYETINFDAIVHSDRHSSNNTNKLKRQNAIDDNRRNTSYCRDARTFLERCIPPPPIEPPPPSDDDAEIVFSPLEFSSETLEKLNSLYSLYKGNRLITNENDETTDVEYRLPDFTNHSSHFLRGRTPMCSLVSVYRHFTFEN